MASIARTPLAIVETGQKWMLQLYQEIQRSRAKLVGPDGKTQSLPVSLYEFLLKLIAELDEGQSVAIVQNDAQTHHGGGARMPGVSRQFLIKLLKRGDIPGYIVRTHRRIYVSDLLAYQAKPDSNRRKILDDLTRAEAEDGLYDLETPDDRTERSVHRGSRLPARWPGRGAEPNPLQKGSCYVQYVLHFSEMVPEADSGGCSVAFVWRGTLHAFLGVERLPLVRRRGGCA